MKTQFHYIFGKQIDTRKQLGTHSNIILYQLARVCSLRMHVPRAAENLEKKNRKLLAIESK